MPIITLNQLGSVGLITDIPDSMVPPNGLTVAENVRFMDGGISRSGAYSPLPVDLSNLNGTAVKVLRVTTSNNQDVLYLCTTQMAQYSTDGYQTTDLTPSGGLIGGAVDKPSGAIVGQRPYFSSAVMPVRGLGASDFEYVMVGSPHEGSTWKVIRAYRDRLFCFNGTQSASNYPQRMQWSGPTATGDLATDWETGDPASTAGWADLSGFQGEIVDAQPLGEHLYVYGTTSVSRVWESGDQFVFNNTPVLSDDGAIAPNCVGVLSEYGHFVVGRKSIYLFDGHQKHDIAKDRVELEFRRTLDTDRLDSVLVYVDHRLNEVWVVYPTSATDVYFTGTARANRALVWNYRLNAWSFRDVPNVSDMVPFAWTAQAETWDGDSTPVPWSESFNSWDAELNTTPVEYQIALGGSIANEYGSQQISLYRFDEQGIPINAVYNNPVSEVARSNLTATNMQASGWDMHMLRRAHFVFHSDMGGSDGAHVALGARMNPLDGWTDIGTIDSLNNTGIRYTPYGTDRHNWINTRLIGNAFRWGAGAPLGADFQLSTVQFDIDPVAGR